jgi:hypothetical protein
MFHLVTLNCKLELKNPCFTALRFGLQSNELDSCWKLRSFNSQPVKNGFQT